MALPDRGQCHLDPNYTRMPEQTRSNTAEDILDIAEMLIQTRGYSAFSYNDIAVKLGIRKPSIHYHFPTKADLGLAVVGRYIERIEAGMTQLMADRSLSPMEIFEHYTGPFVEFADTPDRICLCGALAGEILALPPALREVVQQFFKRHETWLASVLQRGLDDGSFAFAPPPEMMARAIFGALQGALLVKRTTGHADALHDVVSVFKMQLQKPVERSAPRDG